MIQEIKIKNFLSFKNETVFNFEASKDSFAEDCQVVKINENTRLLRFAVIYGYNASGKSNLLKVFDFLCKFWREKKDDVDEQTNVIPFKLDTVSPHEHSRFELIFWVENTKYCYKLELDQKQVYEESLLCYTTTRPSLLFERTLENGQSKIQYGSTLKIAKSTQNNISDFCLRNISFFVARKRVNTSIPQIDSALDWLMKHMMAGILPESSLTKYAQKRCMQELLLPTYLLDFLRGADFNISDISTDSVERPIPELIKDMLLHSAMIPKELKVGLEDEKTIMKIQRTFFEHTVENERGVEKYQLKVVEDGEEEESRGTMRTFGLESAIYMANKNNAFLTIDEIETSLHPKLLELILFKYLKDNSNSQLIVTTHNDGLLDLVDDLIRKDSVWFTEKKKSGETDLYKLTDFKGVNRLSSIREAYRNKRFGATLS